MFVGIIIVLTRLKFYKIFQNKRGLTCKDNPNGGRPWGDGGNLFLERKRLFFDHS
jgi:hypothetical protein